MSYAIITVGGKQYRVREGERLLVDRLPNEEGATFNPRVLLLGGDGGVDLSPTATVTARVVEHVLGEKIRIGKYRPRTGYRRHRGHRSRLTRIEIEAIGASARRAPRKKEAPAENAQPTAEPAEAESRAETATKAEAPARTAHAPKGYEEMTVAQIAEAAPGWRKPNIEAALAYEREHANRKGAIAALESALAAKEGR